MGKANDPTCNAGAREAPEGFTLLELLVVIAIIAVLMGLLVPTVVVARRQVREGATSMEIRTLEAAMVAYYTDWGAYPPDDQMADSAQCLVYYLGSAFSVPTYTRNGGPYFVFPADRLVNGRFIDLLGERGGTDYYQFDNNDADGGVDPPPYTPPPPPLWPPWPNVTNMHPTGVDIWSAGWDGNDAFGWWGARRSGDNDGDGLVDEDPVDGLDNDGDGLVDEDPDLTRYDDLGNW